MTATYSHRVEFTIPGQAVPQGSKTRARNGHMYEANKNLAPWREAAVYAARQARPRSADDGFVWGAGVPVMVQASFFFTRPKSHYGTGRNADRVKPSAPIYKSSPADTDKLQRALGDALTISGLIKDDAQIAEWRAIKQWVNGPASTSVVLWALPAMQGAATVGDLVRGQVTCTCGEITTIDHATCGSDAKSTHLSNARAEQ